MDSRQTPSRPKVHISTTNDQPDADKERRPAVETDPRFPSGPWTGFWMQRGWGKQRMSLSLAFSNGVVTGVGMDVVGRFEFRGNYDLKSGRVRMTKQYVGAHRVEYDGANQDDGLWIWGIWSVFSHRGGFHLWPEGEDDPTQRKAAAELEMPKSTGRLKSGELLPSGV